MLGANPVAHMKSLPRLELVWSLVFVAAMLLWIVLERALGWHSTRIDQHAKFTMLFAVIAIAIYVFALRAKRAQLGGFMSWRQGFVAGVWISVFVTVLSPLSQWLIHTIISPEFFPNLIEYTVAQQIKTREQAEAYFNLRSYMVQSAIGALVMGLVTSASVAIFTRRTATSA